MPYTGDKTLRKNVTEAFQKKKYKKVIKLAEKVFKTDYLDMNTHFMCMMSYKYLENAEKEAFHKFILTGLIDSVVSKGDGRFSYTAYPVISTREEQFIITTLGFVMDRHEEIRTKESIVDKVFVKDLLTGRNKILYFNKDLPNKWLNKKCSKAGGGLDKEKKSFFSMD